MVKKLQNYMLSKIKHPFIMYLSITGAIQGLRVRYPDVFDNMTIKYITISLNIIAGYLCGLALCKLTKKYQFIDNIIWSISVGALYVIIVPCLVTYTVGTIFVIICGIVILYYLLVGILNTYNFIKAETVTRKILLKDIITLLIECMALLTTILSIVKELI